MMGHHEDHYSLRGGEWGYNRLKILSRERWPDTERFLAKAGVRRGMRCADIGSGSGDVTCELAKLVGPEGSAVGLDRDEVKLELARQAARDAGLHNVEFRVASISDWRDPEAFDLVYSRFVLHHLSDPVDALRRMWSAVKPGGVLAIEDVDHDEWAIEPPNAGFDFFATNLREVIRHSGGDPNLGRKLAQLFQSAGTSKPKVSRPSTTRPSNEGKVMPLLTLQSISESIVESGVASQSEIERATVDLERALKDPRSRVSRPMTYQVFAKKSG